MSHHRAIALVFAVHGAVAGTVSTRMPWVQEHLALDPGTLGMALLCPPIGAFIGMPMAARVAHRFGSRAATRVLIGLWCAILVLPPLAPSPVWFGAALLLFGFGAGMSDITMNAHAVVLERRLGRSIMSGLHGMWAVGSLAGGGVGTLAAQAGIDARIHIGLVAAVLLTVSAAAGRGLLRDDRSDTPADVPAPRRFALPSRAILPLGLVGFCAVFAEGAGANWAAVYLTHVTDAGPGLAAAGYTVLMLCMAGMRLAGDRFIRLLGPVTAVRAGGLVAVLGGVLVVTARTPALGIAGFALLGLGLAVVMPLVLTAAGNAGRTASEGVTGVATITYLSGMVAPPVTGWLADGLSYPAAFTAITGVVVVMVLLSRVVRPSAGPSPQPVAEGSLVTGP
ncbi:putative transport protein [[Actinomadura] parvosata subsp. kistnae]|uniref:MFS transporter n=1 Tax=[Actinomadura] parvosata subsp. kistnae TaxID=1909395 RepID=A0A1V0A6V2_9ACTN|nr:MFS transporter [Nonomuraea sp. ATCC 55076]AQZ65910.1 MFS transporter [Nonomuraea sp. ATCC 55076]SPL97361.1 putative transport protein [Actinomadura parvosata subsp. kistnae]